MRGGANCGPAGFGPTAQNKTFKTISGPCYTPTNPGESIVGATKARITWDSQPLIWRYRIRYREQGTTGWAAFVKDNTWTHHWITGLASNTTYEWQIRSICTVNGVGTSWSALRTFTTGSTAKHASSFLSGSHAAGAIEVFPNPGNGHFNVVLPTTDGTPTLMLYDMRGALLHRQRATNEGPITQLNVAHLPPGMYVLQLQGKQLLHRQRLVIQ